MHRLVFKENADIIIQGRADGSVHNRYDLGGEAKDLCRRHNGGGSNQVPRLTLDGQRD
jgi:hypothetical protein